MKSPLPPPRPVNRLLIGLLLLPLVAVGAYFWTNGIMATVENYRSPLADSVKAGLVKDWQEWP